ncbi:MAG: TIGR02186 family protein [Desulfobulbus sp.]|uniref:TIGR02186 family protein n=1 Tax=Desulfobulbus sp. TaxID=895 RepID=UPI00283EB805|nr:TIGR02186 family protein [Desulfobulbus sp.]MDR2550159.1 TIGR02186 family protein [Desulfobulbus sp.]
MYANLIAYCGRLILAVLILAAPDPASAATDALSLSPSAIVMGAQYSGVDLTVTGSVPVGADVIVRLTGTANELHLREKGKVFGLLWMNVGKVIATNVPSVYLVSGSRPLPQMGAGAAPYRLESLVGTIGVKQEGTDDLIDIPHELLRLKEHEGLYRESAEGVSLSAATGASQRFTAHIKVPPSLKPGEYRVEAIALKNGAVVGQSQTAIAAALTGFPKWLSELASQKSALYGIMATVVAIFSGLAIGLVCQSKKPH